MKTQKQIKQFILDTLLPYKLDPTTCAVRDQLCQYLTEDGRKCAVGKYMKKGKWQNEQLAFDQLMDKYDINKILYKKALGYDLDFEVWLVMQKYHDSIGSPKGFTTPNSHVRWLQSQLDINLSELLIEAGI